MGLIFVVLYWASFFGCYWLAKAKGLSPKKWVLFCIPFGFITFLVLLTRKRSEVSAKSMIQDQAAESLRTVRYSVDNLSSRIGISKFRKK